MVSHLIRCIAITYWIFKSLQQMPIRKNVWKLIVCTSYICTYTWRLYWLGYTLKVCLKSNRTGVANNLPQFPFSTTLLCTAGRFLLGYPSVSSLESSWWPPPLQNWFPLWSPWTWGKEKSHMGQDQVNREDVLLGLELPDAQHTKPCYFSDLPKSLIIFQTLSFLYLSDLCSFKQLTNDCYIPPSLPD